VMLFLFINRLDVVKTLCSRPF